MIPQLLSIVHKGIHWCRIGLGLRRLKRANPAERAHAQQVLAALLAESRGLAMKMGQIMAGSDDNNAFQPLVSSIEPLLLSEIQGCLEKQLTQALRSLDESEAAASLGQVHHAVLQNGDDVAVKIRYPGIVEAVRVELKLTDWLPDAGPVKRWRFNSADYKNTLHRQLLRETDYRIEMQTQQRFKQKLAVPGLHIPEIYPDLCTDAVLVQSWETGCRFREACTWSKKIRLEIGRTLLMTLWQSLFVHGEVHGDPHPGNYLFRIDSEGDAQTVLLDFGCTVLIDRQRRLALLKLLDACHAGREIDASRCFVAMGFDAEKLTHLSPKMPGLCNILFRPFIVQRPFHTKEWRLSASLQASLGEQRWWFRAAGPADLMLLLRAFHGVSQQVEQLDIALPWWPLLRHVVGEALLEEARALELSAPASSLATGLTRIGAHRLSVRITENGVATVSLDLPAEAATDLASIIPKPVMAEIQAALDIDLLGLTRRLQREGISPQELFSLDNGHKQCRVWLE